MTDRMVLRVSDEWAIFADRNQWIISKARKRGVGCDWTPKAYIATNKAKLLSTLLKKAETISPQAEAELATWPDDFLSWKTMVSRM